MKKIKKAYKFNKNKSITLPKEFIHKNKLEAGKDYIYIELIDGGKRAIIYPEKEYIAPTPRKTEISIKADKIPRDNIEQQMTYLHEIMLSLYVRSFDSVFIQDATKAMENELSDMGHLIRNFGPAMPVEGGIEIKDVIRKIDTEKELMNTFTIFKEYIKDLTELLKNYAWVKGKEDLAITSLRALFLKEEKEIDSYVFLVQRGINYDLLKRSGDLTKYYLYTQLIFSIEHVADRILHLVYLILESYQIEKKDLIKNPVDLYEDYTKKKPKEDFESLANDPESRKRFSEISCKLNDFISNIKNTFEKAAKKEEKDRE
ncbi:MAG: hypothetical protein ACE5KE_13450, partial [Methanosarcinales archaeon]